MKIDTMRKIDYIAGIPLCLLFSFLNLFIPTRRKKQMRAEKVLFIELSEMGSAILVDPALQRAKELYGAELFFVIFKRNKMSLDILKTIPDKNIFVIRDNSIFSIILDAIRFFLWCIKNEIQATVDLELFSRASALLSFLTLAPIKVGFNNANGEGLYRGNFQSHRIAYNPHIHITRNFLALVEGVYSKSGSPILKTKFDDRALKMTQAKPNEKATTRVKNKIRELYPEYQSSTKIILVNPNASEFLPQRKWPLNHYTELIQILIHNHPNHLVLLTGSPAEREEIDGIVKEVNSERCINFAGEVAFLDLIPLYHLSQILITNDSGPGHFSSVTPIKSFVFFGPETPSLYGSLGNSTPIYSHFSCSPCVSAYNHRKTDCDDNQCLKTIRPLMVYGIVKSSITETRRILTAEEHVFDEVQSGKNPIF